MAPATPAMFPVPIVADNEVISAWKGVISPSVCDAAGRSIIEMP